MWILLSTSVRGEQEHFQMVHNAFAEVLDQLQEIIRTIVTAYQMELKDAMKKPMGIIILQNVSSNIYILDISGFMDPERVRKYSVGRQLFHFWKTAPIWSDLENNTPPKASDINSLNIYMTLNEHMIPQIAKVACHGYNLTLADSANGTVIEDVTVSRCGGSTLRSFIIGKPSVFRHLKRISLINVPITELTVKDLMCCPELHLVAFENITVSQLENRLLCNNLNITLFYYKNSFGYLTIFPNQIFSCTIDLKLEYFHLEDHSITSLPAHAFGSAAKQLRVLYLWKIGLKVIHKDAFSGLCNLQLMKINYNKLLQVSSAILPPASTSLRMVEYWDNGLKGILNLTTTFITKYSSLQMFVWTGSYISDVSGKLCSDQFHSALEIILLVDNMIETIQDDIFHHCISLKFVSLVRNGLAYLPQRLFASNVSQLENLLLMGNRLSSNTSWSDVLMPLHELKYLNLSVNMLTSWTYNLSGIWELEILDLSHNAITTISHIAFINLSMIKFLSLEENSLAFLTPKLRHASSHIPLLNLNSNNIYQLNMSTETMPTNTVILDVSANNLTQLDLSPKRKCSPPCGEISLFADDNLLTGFFLPCPNTHKYATVSLTNNKLTDISSIFPNVLVQQCSMETLNLSGNYFKYWDWDLETSQWQYIMQREFGVENRTHNISTMDMTHCGVEYIYARAFSTFHIQFLDLRENALHTLPAPKEVFSYPSVLNAQFNPLECNCVMLWLKKYLKKDTFKRENEIFVTNSSCMEPLWNISMDIYTVPDFMFMCDAKCPQQIHKQCDKADRCLRSDSDADLDADPDAVVCLSSNINNKLSSAFIPVLYQLHISGFNLSTLTLPYAQPHNLTHLNLTSCNIRDIPETAFINVPHLKFLVLANNAIQILAGATFHPLAQMRYLDLSSNQLLSFGADLIKPLFLLENVYLHNNKMKQLSIATLGEFKMLKNLSLHDNPWVCDCNDTFGHWIVEQFNEDILLSPENIICDQTDIPVMLYNKPCMKHVHHGSKAATLVSSVLASVLAVAFVVCILIYKYRHTLSVLVFIYMPRCTRKRTGNDDVRGVFAIYDDQERGARVWIKDSLIPFIEYACPLICYDRDFIIGEDMADNIQNAVEQTNCAIVLLSRRFMQNSWSCCMFQAAFSEMRERKRPYKIILILTPDVTLNMLSSDENCPQDLRVMLKTQRLVYMSKKLYHETLLYLLPDSCRSTRQIMAVRGERVMYFLCTFRI